MQTIINQWPEAISDKKRNFILQLIFTKTQNSHDREQWLDYLESASSSDEADEIEKSLSSNSN